MGMLSSITGTLGTCSAHPVFSNGHVHRRWSPDLWHHHQLYHVFPGRARVLVDVDFWGPRRFELLCMGFARGTILIYSDLFSLFAANVCLLYVNVNSRLVMLSSLWTWLSHTPRFLQGILVIKINDFHI